MAATANETLREDYETLLTGCGLLDRSERGKLALSGPDAIEFLNGQVTNELADLALGEGRYAAFLTHKGKMLGDIRILAVESADGELELLLDTERVALQNLFDMIRRFKVGYRVELHKRTLQSGLLSLLGPQSDEIAPAGLGAAEHAVVAARVGDIDVWAIRTDVGLDLLCAAEDAAPLSTALLERGAIAVAETAAECLRVESGRPRFGVDIDESTIPQEAGLNERAVSFTKGCYLGQETVARLFYKGKPNRHLRGLLLPAATDPGQELSVEGRVVGRLGSVVDSPRHGWIALALVRREIPPGDTVAIGGACAKVVELPFA